MQFDYNDDDQKTWNILKQIDLKDFKCLESLTIKYLTCKNFLMPDDFKLKNTHNTFKNLNLICLAEEKHLLDDTLVTLSALRVPFTKLKVETLLDNL